MHYISLILFLTVYGLACGASYLIGHKAGFQKGNEKTVIQFLEVGPRQGWLDYDKFHVAAERWHGRKLERFEGPKGRIGFHK